MSNFIAIKSKAEKNNATLVAVSKTRSVDDIMNLYNQGQHVFAENRVQELEQKVAQLPKDIEWHLIGHLQSNKVKQVLPLVSTIHSVDSLKLLLEIEKEAQKIDKKIKVLLQMHVASEDTKFGMNKMELIELLEAYFLPTANFTHTQVIGVMGMASLTNNEKQIREEFKALKNWFNFIKEGYFIQPYFKELSMGMSSDYDIALEEGSTMIRVGSLLFS